MAQTMTIAGLLGQNTFSVPFTPTAVTVGGVTAPFTVPRSGTVVITTPLVANAEVAITGDYLVSSGKLLQSTRNYQTSALQRIAVGAASAQSAAIQANEVLLQPTTDCAVLVGTNPTAAVATSIPLLAGEKLHLQISPGDKVAVIQSTAAGFLTIIPTV